MLMLSVPTGLLAGMAAVVIKKLTHFIKEFCFGFSTQEGNNFLFFVLPAIGIFLTILVVIFVLRNKTGQGIPGILYAISRNKGRIKPDSMYSSIITSALTVGFGGSVGLEGPSVSTGASIGSNIGQLLGLNQKQETMLIGMGGAAALASIFQAPITGIIFTMEVFMIDISMAAMVPIIVSAFVAILTSYYFLGKAFEYSIIINESFIPSNSLYYVGLGLFAGLTSAYFMRVHFEVARKFKQIGSRWVKFVVGASLLGLLVYLFPALYGDGYEAIQDALNGNMSNIFENSVFSSFKENIWVYILLLASLILLKAFATSFTFAAGGIGGTFAPALFIGAFTGLFYSTLINVLKLGTLNVSKFALVGMSGVIAGMLHAPLTGVFLIAEITNGYSLIVPLMIVSALAYFINRLFYKDSIYTRPVTERGVKVTHNKDVSILNMMTINKLIENNFATIRPDKTIGDLIPIISSSKRNIFPVVGEDGTFEGHILFDDIRSIMFDTTKYRTYIADIMVYPGYTINPNESMEDIVRKFEESNKYNIPVIQKGKYLGYLSRAKVFTTYQETLKKISDE